jgi:hypothetical protein
MQILFTLTYHETYYIWPRLPVNVIGSHAACGPTRLHIRIASSVVLTRYGDLCLREIKLFSSIQYVLTVPCSLFKDCERVVNTSFLLKRVLLRNKTASVMGNQITIFS